MKAHQRIIREQVAADRSEEGLFGSWWETIDTTVANGEVRPITSSQARPVIETYEWLGTMPAIVLHCYGIFFDGVLGGVVVFSPENAENLGVWDKYGYTGKIITLSRGACAHWTRKNTGSKLIAAAIKSLPEKYQVVTATVDEEAGEVGTLYQACNFDYVGVMSKGGKRASLTVNGKTVSGRHLYRSTGTRGHEKMREMGLDVDAVPRKRRYFYFKNKRLRGAIEHLIKPYPKRAMQ